MNTIWIVMPILIILMFLLGIDLDKKAFTDEEAFKILEDSKWTKETSLVLKYFELAQKEYYELT